MAMDSTDPVPNNITTEAVHEETLEDVFTGEHPNQTLFTTPRRRRHLATQLPPATPTTSNNAQEIQITPALQRALRADRDRQARERR